MGNKNFTVIYANIGIILICLFLIVSTYAYITVKDEVSEPIKAEINNKNLKIKYMDTSNVSMVNTYAGDKITKTFYVKNTGNKSIYYDINLEKVTNNFENPDDLVFSLTCDNNGAYVKEKAMPIIDSIIASNIKINPNETQTYTMIITFLKTNEDQVENTNKTYSSNIIISVPKNMENVENIYESDTLGKLITDSSIGNESIINFQNNKTDGIYYTNNTINGSTVYFYRGSNKLNNNVVFADMCWKIIRTTEDNGIRLIYNGKYENNVCNNKNNTLENINEFNTRSNYNAYVGYMYGNASSNNYENEHNNVNPSSIKIYLDSWYTKYLSNYSSLISNDTIYCNNRKTSKFNYGGILYGISGYGNNNSGYLLMNNYYIKSMATFDCNNINDRFSVSNQYSNKSLDNSIGQITLEELYYSGYVSKVDISNNYLYSNSIYWTMTPAYFNGSDAYNFVVNKGKVVTNKVSKKNGIRPVITLNKTVKILSGDGSMNTPFIIGG